MTIGIYVKNVIVRPAIPGQVDLTFDVRDGVEVIEEIYSQLSESEREYVKNL